MLEKPLTLFGLYSIKKIEYLHVNSKIKNTYKMKKRFYLFTMLVALMSGNIQAQKYANTWYFGNQAGLDFNGGAPVAINNSAMGTAEGCSSISDDNGAILFYTDGVSVWNKNHVPMANGTGLGGGSSSTQSACIVKQPGVNTNYYIFTSGEFNSTAGFQYNIVDISTNGGLGSVILKNQILYTPTTERVTAHTHSNGNDIWILSHQSLGSEFVAYLLTSTGLNLVPVITSVGPVFNGSGLDFLGNLKFSPDGFKVAMAVSAPDTFYVFDFDPSSGVISNPISLNSTNSFEGAYSVEFSPSGNVLYATSEIPFKLFQFDLTSGNAATINASRLDIPTIPLGGSYIGGLQLGPDGKIYMTRNTCGWLGVINDPNVAGFGCNYADSGIFLNGASCIYGLPNLNQSAYRFITIEKFCFGDATYFGANDSVNYLAFQWNFGDPGSGPLNVSYYATTSHVFTAPGNYTVELIRASLAPPFGDTTYYDIIINPLPVVNLGNDTTICNGQSYIINPGAFSSYLWQDGTTNSTFAATVTGTYTVTVTEQDCNATDSIVVTVQPCALPLANLSSSDTTFCEKQCIDFFDLTVNNPTSWLWTFNGASPSTSTDQNPAGICYNNYGSFDVQLIACNNLGCDTVLFPSFITEVASPPAPLITQSNDTLFCNTTQVTYAWYNVNNVNLVLGTNNYFVPTVAGSYYVVISDSNDCNVASATFNSNVGFNELLNDGINIFHNQQAGIVYISNTNLTNAIQEIKLFDLQGKCIEKNTLREQTSQIKLPNSSSVYFVNITTTTKNYVVKIAAIK